MRHKNGNPPQKTMVKLKAGILLFLVLVSGCRKEDGPTRNSISIDLDRFSENLHGFNLLGKFDAEWSNYGYSEEEFIIIQDLGFNFARLPLDYRTYTEPGNWDDFVNEEIAEIDKAIEWGNKYGIHVCLNLHRAPGYCVNPSELPANQDLDLWTDAFAQEAFVNHWAYFANRYKDVPYDELSFNLVNEPSDVDETTYVKIMKKAIDRIRSIGPDRVIFVDGLNYGRETIPSLKNEKNIIQAIHVYDPFTLTHYKAEWVTGSDTWPVPAWPMTNIPQYLYGPWKNEYHSELVLEGNFLKDAEITVNVHQVSIQSTLQIMLDDALIFSKSFLCGPDLGEDWTEIVETQWGYQNISGKDYSALLPSAGNRLTLINSEGDWMTLNRISIRSSTGEVVILPANTSWGVKQGTYIITSEGKITDPEGKPVTALAELSGKLESARSEGIPVMIQEFGVYNKTPFDVTIDYLSDVVSIFRDNRTGFAMWNLIGTMGIINSERSGCMYEAYRGKLLDREMTNILKGQNKTAQGFVIK